VIGAPAPIWARSASPSSVPRSDPAPAGEELGAFLATRLAKYKIPKEFVFVDSLPRTAYGKVVKGELAAMLPDEGGGLKPWFFVRGSWFAARAIPPRRRAARFPPSIPPTTNHEPPRVPWRTGDESPAGSSRGRGGGTPFAGSTAG